MSYIYLIMRYLAPVDTAERTFVFDNFFVDKLAIDGDDKPDPTKTFLEARKVRPHKLSTPSDVRTSLTRTFGSSLLVASTTGSLTL